MTYEYSQNKMQRHRRRRRLRALEKIAHGGPVECAICGCPHAQIMDIGHPDHDGKFHRRKKDPVVGGVTARDMVRWVLRTPIEEVLKRVQLECPYCNAWHNRFKVYPPESKRPSWPKMERCPQADYDGHPCYRCKVKDLPEEWSKCPHEVVSERGPEWWKEVEVFGR